MGGIWTPPTPFFLSPTGKTPFVSSPLNPHLAFLACAWDSPSPFFQIGLCLTAHSTVAGVHFRVFSRFYTQERFFPLIFSSLASCWRPVAAGFLLALEFFHRWQRCFYSASLGFDRVHWSAEEIVGTDLPRSVDSGSIRGQAGRRIIGHFLTFSV